jgi:hypothetical protein
MNLYYILYLSIAPRGFIAGLYRFKAYIFTGLQTCKKERVGGEGVFTVRKLYARFKV